jgi:hypothetical protein
MGCENVKLFLRKPFDVRLTTKGIPKGEKVPDHEMKNLQITRHDFRGELSYTLIPRI